MSDLSVKVEELATLMTEFGLEKAQMQGDDWSVELAVNPEVRAGAVVAAAAPTSSASVASKVAPKPKVEKKPAGPTGTPVSSPMTGIYYSSSSPGSPAFAKEGDTVQAGQVVGLIEAMKVFNEIIAPVSGLVTKVAAENGKLVQPGDPLLYIG